MKRRRGKDRRPKRRDRKPKRRPSAIRAGDGNAPIDALDPHAKCPHLSARMRRRLAAGGCFVCDEPTIAFIGEFVPDEPWRYCSAPPTPGKCRALFYAICARCASSPATPALVELKALAVQAPLDDQRRAR